MDRLEDARIAILGLGLIGGSLAMALHGKCDALYGCDIAEDVVALALQRRIVDQASSDPRDVVCLADIIILATPVRAICALLQKLPEWSSGSAVVIDVGSTKVQILATMQALPERFDPIGGHPLCGKENSSLSYAEATLYAGANFVLCPLERTSMRARKLALELVHALGAVPLWMDAQKHDLWIASTSHLPYLLSNALAATTPTEVAPLVGPGFRSTSRLAPSSLPMMLDIIATNRLNILAALRRFRDHLNTLESALSSGDEDELYGLLCQGMENYRNFVPKDGEWTSKNHRKAAQP